MASNGTQYWEYAVHKRQSVLFHSHGARRRVRLFAISPSPEAVRSASGGLSAIAELVVFQVRLLLKRFDKDGNNQLDVNEFVGFYAEAKAM